MDWKEFWHGLSPSEKREYANSCGSTYEAMTTAYVYGEQIPRPEKMAVMALQTGGVITPKQLVKWFVTKKVSDEYQRLRRKQKRQEQKVKQQVQKEENPANGV